MTKEKWNVKKVEGEVGKEELDAARAYQQNGIKVKAQVGNWGKFFLVHWQGKMLVLSVNYTNAKLAEGLRQEGVPLIIDEDTQDSATKSIAKKMKFAMESGGGPGTVKMYKADEEGAVIEGTGGPIFPRNANFLISGEQLLEEIKKIADEEGLEIFLWTRGNRVTDIAQQRPTKRQTPKFKTKIYFVPKGKANFSEGTNNKFSDIPETCKKLLNASYFTRAFDNPGQNSVVFELTMRQPDKQATHKISLFS